MSAPARVDRNEASRLLELDALIEASAADQALRDQALSPGFRAVRSFIRDPAFEAAGRVFAALATLAPEGALVAELAPVLDLPVETAAAALALLDVYGALEFSGEAEARAVRLEKGMR